MVGLSVGRGAGDAEESLEELKRLTDTAGAEVVDTLLQRRDRPDPATFLGKGKGGKATEFRFDVTRFPILRERAQVGSIAGFTYATDKAEWLERRRQNELAGTRANRQSNVVSASSG